MFEEYKKDLLKFFQIKKENHLLAENLESLGREKLKKECIRIFRLKNTQKDKDFVRSVFDPTNEYEDQMRSIEKFDLDKFRPLINFLTEKVKTIRDDKLVKLFAWLIDFPANEKWRELSDEEKKRVFEDAARKKKITKKNDGGQTTDPKSNQSVTRLIPNTYIIISCILLLSIGSISFLAWERMATSVRMPKADEKFMYWDGDHYEPVKDGEQAPGVTIIPLNLKTLKEQRKITLPDTLTKYSLGKVWYKGYGKGHEYFTDSGIYPPDTSRRLKPLSTEILKYSSYDRYLLTRLVWFICAAFFVSLCGYWASTLKKEVKQPVEEGETDNAANIYEAELAQ